MPVLHCVFIVFRVEKLSVVCVSLGQGCVYCSANFKYKQNARNCLLHVKDNSICCILYNTQLYVSIVLKIALD